MNQVSSASAVPFEWLFTASAPWLYRTLDEDFPIHIPVEGSRLHELRIVRLDCGVTTTPSGVFQEFQQKLEFPRYFGHNWDALDECIVDLEWIPASAYALVFTEASALLKFELDELGILIEILTDAAREWSVPINVGESWDRVPVPFHSIMLDTADGLRIFGEHLSGVSK